MQPRHYSPRRGNVTLKEAGAKFVATIVAYPVPAAIAAFTLGVLIGFVL